MFREVGESQGHREGKTRCVWNPCSHSLFGLPTKGERVKSKGQVAEMLRPPEFASLTGFPGHKHLLASYFQNICEYKFLFACLTGHIVSPQKKVKLLLVENIEKGFGAGR